MKSLESTFCLNNLCKKINFYEQKKFISKTCKYVISLDGTNLKTSFFKHFEGIKICIYIYLKVGYVFKIWIKTKINELKIFCIC